MNVLCFLFISGSKVRTVLFIIQWIQESKNQCIVSTALFYV